MGQSTYLFKKNSGKEKNISNFEKDYSSAVQEPGYLNNI